MSILINGMEMPKEPLMLILFPDGHISTEEYNIGANAFATAIPSHARWIDDTKLGLTDFEIVMCNGDYKEALKMLLEKIEKAPTITNFTPEESELYWKSIKARSIPTGISIDDLMEMKE